MAQPGGAGGRPRGGRVQASPSASSPPGASDLDGWSKRREFIQLLGASLALTGGRLPPPQPEDRPLRAPAARGDPGQRPALRDRLQPGGLRQRPAGRQPRRPPHQDRGQPRPPGHPGRHQRLRAGAAPRPLRSDSARQLTPQGAADRLARLLADAGPRSAELANDGGARLRFLVEPELVAADRRPARAHPAEASPRPSSSPTRRWPRTARPRAPGSRSASRSRPSTTFGQADVILSLDSDFLTDGPEQIRLHRQFSARPRARRDDEPALRGRALPRPPTGSHGRPPAARAAARRWSP